MAVDACIAAIQPMSLITSFQFISVASIFHPTLSQLVLDATVSKVRHALNVHDGEVMPSIKWRCGMCKTDMLHRVRYVSDLLPPNVHVLECTGCGNLGITLVEIAEEVTHA